MEHNSIPTHEKLSEKEAKSLLEKHQTSFEKLPKILAADPAIKELSAKVGDIIKITRKSPVAGQTIYYRGVVSE